MHYRQYSQSVSHMAPQLTHTIISRVSQPNGTLAYICTIVSIVSHMVHQLHNTNSRWSISQTVSTPVHQLICHNQYSQSTYAAQASIPQNQQSVYMLYQLNALYQSAYKQYYSLYTLKSVVGHRHMVCSLQVHGVQFTVSHRYTVCILSESVTSTQCVAYCHRYIVCSLQIQVSGVQLTDTGLQCVACDQSQVYGVQLTMSQSRYIVCSLQSQAYSVKLTVSHRYMVCS